MGFLDGRLKRHQEILADDSFGVVAGRGVGAAFGLAVHGEMLGGGHHMMVTDLELVALQSGDGCYTDARGQVRVFAVGLFGAAPAWIACDVEHRAEDLAHTGRARLIASRGEHAAHQSRIPGAGQRQRLRKAGAAVAHESVQCLAHE